MKQFIRLCLVLSLFPLFSCAARIDGSLSADGSAALSVNMSMEPRMTSLVRSLAAAAGQTNGQVLNGPAIAKSMTDSSSGNVKVTLRNTTPSAVEGAIQISNISRFLAAGETGGFINFRQAAAGGSCEIKIDLDNGPALLSVLSPEISDYLNALMAPMATGEKLSKTEYLELVASVYSKAISDEIAASRIRASIDFPGQITAVRGGTFSGRKANFDIPLLDLLVLETPINYEVKWN